MIKQISKGQNDIKKVDRVAENLKKMKCSPPAMQDVFRFWSKVMQSSRLLSFVNFVMA